MMSGGGIIVLSYFAFLMKVSESDGCHNYVSIFITFCIIYCIIYIIGLINGPQNVFVPHLRHEHMAVGNALAGPLHEVENYTDCQELCQKSFECYYFAHFEATKNCWLSGKNAFRGISLKVKNSCYPFESSADPLINKQLKPRTCAVLLSNIDKTCFVWIGHR